MWGSFVAEVASKRKKNGCIGHSGLFIVQVFEILKGKDRSQVGRHPLLENKQVEVYQVEVWSTVHR